jgi:hypothetical protein
MNQTISNLARVDTTWHPINRKDHRVITHNDYDVLITEPTVVYCDGSLVAVYLPNGVWQKSDLDELLFSLEELYFYVDPQRRTAGLSAATQTFGSVPRRAIRTDFCHIAALANSHPELHERLCELGKYASDIYARFVPDVWQQHLETVTATMEKKHLVSGVYTGGVVNKNSALGGHTDAGNVAKTWNSQLTIKKDIEDSYLVMPEFRVALEVADGSMALFEAQSVWHGVTPVLKTRKNSVRYSVVWYSTQALKNCLPRDEEIQRIQRKKTEREWRRAGLI